jgi:hypothetical protein
MYCKLTPKMTVKKTMGFVCWKTKTKTIKIEFPKISSLKPFLSIEG